jgi:hypothetical protein
VWDFSKFSVSKVLFSPQAETALKAFVKGNEVHYDTYFEYLDGRCADAKKCLEALIACSKTDLRIQSRLFQKRMDGS